jgi:hypothetical protein
MAKKAATKKEREHMGRVASLCCIICGQAATVHHINARGMGMRSSHFETIGLCPKHHQYGPFGHAVHNGLKTFEANYGTEAELLEKVRRKLETRYPQFNPINGEQK